jgi:hypothetical protein
MRHADEIVDAEFVATLRLFAAAKRRQLLWMKAAAKPRRARHPRLIDCSCTMAATNR